MDIPLSVFDLSPKDVLSGPHQGVLIPIALFDVLPTGDSLPVVIDFLK